MFTGKMSDTISYEETSEALVKEVYARFGLAYYHSECLHRALCSIHALAPFRDATGITRPRLDEKFAHAYSLTLGQVKDEIRGLIPEELSARLDEGVKKRNFLAHQFWFERVHLMFSETGLAKILQELDEYSALFQRLDEMASACLKPQVTKLGITDEILQNCLDEILSGKEAEPFYPKRKLKKRERIVGAWEFAVPEGGKTLVLEADDGQLWQLCDVGLGWTYYDHVKPDWREKKTIAQYLPANIDTRPKVSKPWHYEFKLAKGAVLWVRPGKGERHFRYGIRTEERNIHQGSTAPLAATDFSS